MLYSEAMMWLFDIAFAKDLCLDPDAVRNAAGIDRLSDLRDKDVRALPPLPGMDHDQFREIFISMLRDSISRRERLWLIPMTEETRTNWEEWLPEGLVQPMGARQDYFGTTVTPVGISPMQLVGALLDRFTEEDRIILWSALTHLDGLDLSSEIYEKTLERGIPIIPRTRASRLLNSPKFLAYVAVLTYSALRALPVTFVKQFHGSLVVLWAIDLITAVPYTWGILTMVTARRFWKRIVGMAVTIVSFVAPYIYFGSHGKHYPPEVVAIIFALIFGTFALEGYKMWGDRQVARQLLGRWRV
ncbi:hypothetical protein GCM10025785_14310 [Corynebacterium canis]